MPIQYVLDGTRIESRQATNQPSLGELAVKIYGHQAFMKECVPDLNYPLAGHAISRTLASHADLFDSCAAGVFSIPQKEHLLEARTDIGFYLDESTLILVDDTDQCALFVEALAHAHRKTPPSLARVLFLLMESFFENDAAFLEKFEARLAAAEEHIMDAGRMESNPVISQVRRELLRLDYYYEQMETIGDLFEENANDLFDIEDARLFGIFTRHANRLFNRTRTLKEYSLQLYELQQTQLDVRQNETMRWLTVVTSIFVPLTLVTSWYGMNFKGMPELDWQFGYAGVIAICLVIVVAELIYFRKRRWL